MSARAALAAAALCLAAPAARADGAFPDSTRVFAPADRPGELVLATNFGIVSSQDGGTTWSWACEQPPAANAGAYQMGPGRRLFGIAIADAVYSDDLGCHWTTAAVGVPAARVLDVFPDPIEARRVFAAVAIGDPRDQQSALLASGDGGAHFDAVLLRPPAQTTVLGVESARSRPATVYAVLREGPGTHPRLARSDDGGASWTIADVEAAVGAWDLGLVAVDPANPRKLFLRVLAFPDEALAVSDDGGSTARVVARIARGTLSAFGRRADGSLLLGGVSRDGATVLASRDGGETWAPWARPPHARDFADRDGTLYVVGDDAVDGFALAQSTAPWEDGAGLRRVMRFADVTSVRACAFAACAAACAAEVARSTFPAAVCETAEPPAVDDAAAAAPDAGMPGAAPPRAARGSCAVGLRGAAPGVALAVLAVALGALGRRVSLQWMWEVLRSRRGRRREPGAKTSFFS